MNHIPQIALYNDAVFNNEDYNIIYMVIPCVQYVAVNFVKICLPHPYTPSSLKFLWIIFNISSNVQPCKHKFDQIFPSASGPKMYDFKTLESVDEIRRGVVV